MAAVFCECALPACVLVGNGLVCTTCGGALDSDGYKVLSERWDLMPAGRDALKAADGELDATPDNVPYAGEE